MPAIAPSKIAPCLWFEREGEEAANSYAALFPNSRVDVVHRNVVDGPGGKAGSVLFVEFTLAGQRFQALNGGSKPNYDHSLSLSVACEDQAELDKIWNGLLQGGKEQQCGWVTDRYGVNWQVVPAKLTEWLSDPDPAKKNAVLQAVWKMVKLDIAAIEAAYRGAGTA